MNRIETDRILLRLWKMEDADDLYEYAKDPEIGLSAGWKPHDSVEESREIIKRFTDLGKPGVFFALEEKKSGKVIGLLGIQPDPHRLHMEQAFSIGFVLSRAFWGKGLMAETVSAAMDYAFQSCDAQLLSAYHYPFNKRSQRLIEKSGFHYERTLCQAARRYDGAVLDLCCYSMTVQEYGELKKRLCFPRE